MLMEILVYLMMGNNFIVIIVRLFVSIQFLAKLLKQVKEIYKYRLKINQNLNKIIKKLDLK